jgi:hypothetical protein
MDSLNKGEDAPNPDEEDLDPNELVVTGKRIKI